MTTIIRTSESQQRMTETKELSIIDLATQQNGTDTIMVQRALLQPGCSSTPHFHDRQEVVVFLAGTVDILYNETMHTVLAGDTFIIDANTIHQVINNGSEVSDALVCMPIGTKTLFPENKKPRTSSRPQVRLSPLGRYRQTSTSGEHS